MFLRILAYLMTPIEFLVSTAQIFKTETENTTLLKLNWLLTTSKIACTNLNVIKCILRIIKENMIKVSLYDQLIFEFRIRN